MTRERPDRQALNYWQDREQRTIAAHLLDQFELAKDKGLRQITPFLSSAMTEWAIGTAKKFKLNFLAAGGFPESERVRLILSPDLWEESQDGVSILQVQTGQKGEELEHRQILGSLMGLGLDRQVIGDIRAGKNGYYIAVTDQIAPWLEQNWQQAGRNEIQVSLFYGTPELEEQPGDEKRITVSSSRLDSLLAAGFNLSRSMAQELIGQGKAKVNDKAALKQDMELFSGDRISCRGFGRINLGEKEETRKGRIAWKVIVFRSQR